MNEPKLHHYVPQFYLRRFANESGRLWVWDRDQDRTFAVKPDGVAAETNFYRLDEFAEAGHDPLTMEKQFSYLEGGRPHHRSMAGLASADGARRED